MDIDFAQIVDLTQIIARAVVWIVGLVIVGRVGTYVASKYFSQTD